MLKMKLFHPEVFQGSLSNNRYFEGWYIKHVSADLSQVYAFIPGLALNKGEKHAFIQIIDGLSGKTWNINYPLSAFRYSKKKFEVWVGQSFFSSEKTILDIDSETLKIKGELQYSNLIKYPSTAFSPGIMGWYSFAPFMECKHGIVSVNHQIAGAIQLNGKTLDFNDGTGYIEKDWGKSFPESWIWLHCNTFSERDCSFTFSVAKIPWLGNFFIGHICFLYLKGKFYRFATYTGSKITKLQFNPPQLDIEMKSKDFTLKIKATQNRSGELKAPAVGEMNRIIKESVDSGIEISLLDKNGELLFSDKGKRAGLEIIEKILTYF